MSIRQGEKIIAGSGAGNLDNITITINENGDLQAEGTLEKNKKTAKYDWIGTLNEYYDQDIENMHPDWICYITDDTSGGNSVYTKKEVDAMFNTNPRTGHFIGEWVLSTTATNIVPEGCIKPDGFEQLDAPNSMFADLWNNCLIPTENFGGQSYLDTCTYEEYYKSISEYGACAKWAVDLVNKKFKVPFVPDGYFIEQGEGTIKKPGLPNIEGQASIGGLYNVSYTLLGTGYEGAFKPSEINTTGSYNGSRREGVNSGLKFDASASNPIYGASNTVQPKSIGARWFIYIANAEIGDFAVNWNKMQNELLGRDAVIDQKVNPDGSFYRRYKSGWLEQGSKIPAPITSVPLLKPYKTANYLIVLGRYSDNNTEGIPRVKSQTTTDFNYNSARNDCPSYWVAYGQGA